MVCFQDIKYIIQHGDDSHHQVGKIWAQQWHCYWNSKKMRRNMVRGAAERQQQHWRSCRKCLVSIKLSTATIFLISLGNRERVANRKRSLTFHRIKTHLKSPRYMFRIAAGNVVFVKGKAIIVPCNSVSTKPSGFHNKAKDIKKKKSLPEHSWTLFGVNQTVLTLLSKWLFQKKFCV